MAESLKEKVNRLRAFDAAAGHTPQASETLPVQLARLSQYERAGNTPATPAPTVQTAEDSLSLRRTLAILEATQASVTADISALTARVKSLSASTEPPAQKHHSQATGRERILAATERDLARLGYAPQGIASTTTVPEPKPEPVKDNAKADESKPLHGLDRAAAGLEKDPAFQALMRNTLPNGHSQHPDNH